MKNSDKLKRYSMFIAGVIFSALGISLITKAGLGTSPITSLAFVLTFIFPHSLGEFTMLVNTVMFLIQAALLGKAFGKIQLLQLPAALLFSACIDGWMYILGFWKTGSYVGQVLMLLLAVLEKRGGLMLSGCDAYVNVIGGLSLEEPAADLAAMIAFASSFRDRPVPSDLAAIGEIGLTGELRAVSALGQRLSEVRRLGFTKCLIPKRVQGKLSVPEGLDVIRVANIREALAAIL